VEGVLLEVMVHEADLQDRDGGRLLLTSELKSMYPRLEVVLGDSGYRGRLVRHVHDEVEGLELTIVQRSDAGNGSTWVKDRQPVPTKERGFKVLPKRWIVERTFAWFSLNRRLSKDYEANPRVSETWLWIAMAGILVRRFTK
jgi:transposase